MWISCRVRSDSHTLSEAPFALFQSAESNVRVHSVRERDFQFSVRAPSDSDPESVQVHHGHHVTNALLIALNVGSLGSFFWYEDPWVHPVLTVADEFGSTDARGAALVVTSDTAHETLRPITGDDVYNTALIFGVVAREDSRVLTGEYCRGLLLLRMNFYDLNFRREAFMCFYRALEHFAANRILGVTKLQNELRDLQRALSRFVKSPDLMDELRNIYSIRSSQVAHAQIGQRDITLEEVQKTKIFLDFVMHKTFKEQANRMMEQRRDAEPAGDSS